MFHGMREPQLVWLLLTEGVWRSSVPLLCRFKCSHFLFVWAKTPRRRTRRVHIQTFRQTLIHVKQNEEIFRKEKKSKENTPDLPGSPLSQNEKLEWRAQNAKGEGSDQSSFPHPLPIGRQGSRVRSDCRVGCFFFFNLNVFFLYVSEFSSIIGCELTASSCIHQCWWKSVEAPPPKKKKLNQNCFCIGAGSLFKASGLYGVAMILLISFSLSLFLKTGSHCVTLASLELAL